MTNSNDVPGQGQAERVVMAQHRGLMMMGRTELCAWLRANSSGIYRPAAEAADEIENLAKGAGVGAWLPIATAPAGVMLLFADMRAAEARHWVFCGWRHSGLRGDSVQMPDNTARTATHWTKLPAPPRSVANEGEEQ